MDPEGRCISLHKSGGFSIASHVSFTVELMGWFYLENRWQVTSLVHFFGVGETNFGMQVVKPWEFGASPSGPHGRVKCSTRTFNSTDRHFEDVWGFLGRWTSPVWNIGVIYVEGDPLNTIPRLTWSQNMIPKTLIPKRNNKKHGICLRLTNFVGQ